MNCTHCNRPIVLVPSASERAAKYGGKASDYIKLFTIHSNCQLIKRAEETKQLIKREYS